MLNSSAHGCYNEYEIFSLQGMRLFFCALILLFVSCNTALKYKPTENIRNNSSIVVDSNLHYFLHPWRDSLNRFVHKPIGYSDTAFHNTDRSGNLGSLLTDIMLQNAIAFSGDSLPIASFFAVLNFGGLRSSLPSDTIRWEDIFSVMPFENEMVILRLSGIDTDSLLQQIAKNGGEPIAGITMEVTKGICTRAYINNQRFDSRRDYWIITNDYMANGGDRYTMLTHPKQRIGMQIKLRDVFAKGIEAETKMYGNLLHRDKARIQFHE